MLMMKGLSSWLNRNLLFSLSVFLLAFIPLFPKLPILDALPGYIVRVRVEDFLILFTGIIWLRAVITRRIEWRSSYFWFVALYAVVGIVSIGLAAGLLQTIPLSLLHMGKSALHLFRYLEYFSLFFILFTSIRNKKQVYIALAVTVLTLLGVVGYGIGQKYLHFPVYSTMNREYSKGEKLYLEQGARPQSTFAGHYDLAAYLVIVLPLLFSLSIGLVRKPFAIKWTVLAGVIFSSFGLGTLMLVLTGSKTSILGFVIAIALVVVLHLLRLHSPKKRVQIGAILVGAAILLAGVGWWTAPASFKGKIDSVIRKLQPSTQDRPNDLVGDNFENKLVGTVQSDGTVKYDLVRTDKTWSANALKYGLSMGIRLDTLWPQALKGFSRNPLTGSGYGTLAMLDTNLFQEADSTDNNYLRTLGETGLLGFIAFYGFLAFIGLELLTFARKQRNKISGWLSMGLAGSLAGLIISAFYLDVFAASKVAFMFWGLTGLVLKSARLEAPNLLKQEELLKPVKALTAHFRRNRLGYLLLLIAFFLFHQDPFMMHTPLKDIEPYTAGLEQLTAARCFLSTGVFNLCRNSGLVLSPHANLYALLLVPLLKLFGTVNSFYYLNLILVAPTFLLSYFSLRRKVSEHNLFLSLFSGLGIAVFLRLTATPLSMWQLLVTIFALPLFVILVSIFLQVNRSAIGLIVRKVLFVLVIGIFLNTILLDQFGFRFRNLAQNEAYAAVKLADGYIAPAGQSANLVTLINPYYLDQYTLNKYAVLPLSNSQPYSRESSKVWGIPDTNDLPKLFNRLLTNNEQIYVSDYLVNTDPKYRDDFKSLKNNFDFSYVALGCEEHCNLFRLDMPSDIKSPLIAPLYVKKSLDPLTLGDKYRFAVVSSRFDPKGQTALPPDSTTAFTRELARLISEPPNFMFLTGEVATADNIKLTDQFLVNFENKVKYPVLYSPGNKDLLPVKYLTSGYQEFYVNSEYFILMEVGPDSQISMASQLLLYNSFLKLEKLPQIKSLFIISHDLNWQTKEDTNKAMQIIQKKLAEFPNIHAYIITDNHGSNITSVEKQNISYFASNISLEPSDTYLSISVKAGKITVTTVNPNE